MGGKLRITGSELGVSSRKKSKAAAVRFVSFGVSVQLENCHYMSYTRYELPYIRIIHVSSATGIVYRYTASYTQLEY